MFRFLKIILLLFFTSILSCTIPATKGLKLDEEPCYKTITIDLTYVSGFKPTEQSLKLLENRILEYKIADLVTIREREVSNSLVFLPLTKTFIRLFEQHHRQLYDYNLEDDDLIIFMACIPGPYIDNDYTNIAGLKYENTSIAIFMDCISTDNQGSVMLHELGHILTLVDIKNRNQEPINPDRPQHCNNENCAMYWIIRQQGACFGQECLRDLRRLALQRHQ